MYQFNRIYLFIFDAKPHILRFNFLMETIAVMFITKREKNKTKEKQKQPCTDTPINPKNLCVNELIHKIDMFFDRQF